ncbi:putative restriction endonuclease [Lausannevirus]|uniref:Putative restriction endonuclease n=1 Tax=Lausannevirus TaxID=999883 RepID=F2WLW8_9VIRU|nr:putative restriction endonuclease [Lausannevirus]AEA07241.1 putative restriction endonuclease [Lausannevirus]
MNCETRKKGKLCGREECKPCFSRSFASCDKAKYMVEGQRNPLVVFRFDKKKLAFKCPKCFHDFEMAPNNLSVGQFCPFCSSSKLCCSDDCRICFEKSFASHEKSKYCNVQKSKFEPKNVFLNSSKKLWFDCPMCDHQFEAAVEKVFRGRFCPFCKNKKLCYSESCDMCYKNSFASHPKAKFWITEKNKSTARNVAIRSSKKIWVRCEKGHEFESDPNNISRGSWCAICKNKTEEKLLRFLEKHFENVVFQFEPFWSKNPRTGCYLPFDFCVSKTIIELDGRQHFQQVKNWKSPEQQQKVDRYKEKCALKNGYSVVRILQRDVWLDRGEWQKILLESIMDRETPVVECLWQGDPYKKF